MNFLDCLRTTLLLAPMTLIAAGETVAADRQQTPSWPQWRGPLRDGVSRETGLLREWSASGPPLRWRIEGLGAGYSSLAVTATRIYTAGDQDGSAVLVALDRSDGKTLWTTSIGDGSPQSTPTVDGERVFMLGREGDIVCAHAVTGALL